MYASQSEEDEAIRSFAAGKTSFAALQRHGLENFLIVLERLGELGLRPPIAPLEGQNADLRSRARAIIADRIRGP